MAKRKKTLRSIGSLKQQRPNDVAHSNKTARTEETFKQLVTSVVDVGPPANWVKINVRQTKDCFEVYALVPGLLREEGYSRKFYSFALWASSQTQLPPPNTCDSKNGPTITASRIQLKDGRHLAYKEYRVPKDNAKQKIVFVHGFDSCRKLLKAKECMLFHSAYLVMERVILTRNKQLKALLMI